MDETLLVPAAAVSEELWNLAIVRQLKWGVLLGGRERFKASGSGQCRFSGSVFLSSTRFCVICIAFIRCATQQNVLYSHRNRR